MKIKYRVKIIQEDNLVEYPDGIFTFTRKTPDFSNLLSSSGSTYLTSMYENGVCNGYVALPEGHYYYGENYMNLDIEVHGGLTYGCEEEFNGKKYWVLGFDTCHSGDNKTNCSEEYVLNELKELYKQL